MALLAALLYLGACGQSAVDQSVELRGQTMATSYSITLVRPPTTIDLDQLRRDIEDTLSDIEKMASTYDPHSEISRFNQRETSDWQSVSTGFCAMISDALAMSVATQGNFDPSIGRAVEAWGFGAKETPASLPRAEVTQRISAEIGFNKLRVDCNRPALQKTVASVALDLSAWVKGHAVDAIATYLHDRGLENYVVEIGGEVRAAGTNRDGQCFRIGIESPQRDDRTLDISIPLCDAAVATSGNYRNFFVADGKTYSHTIDPRTARPVDHTLASVTVIDDRAADADAIATALLVLGPKDGPARAAEEQIAALFVMRNGDKYRTESSPAFESLR